MTNGATVSTGQYAFAITVHTLAAPKTSQPVRRMYLPRRLRASKPFNGETLIRV